MKKYKYIYKKEMKNVVGRFKINDNIKLGI